MKKTLEQSDKVMYQWIQKEKQRLQTSLELIPSENFVSKSVLEALGSTLTNKYSEGYPGKRYYGGNAFIDEIELLAQERAKALFGAEHVNVQPYSGSPANLAVLQALVPLGEKIMGMDLAHGGHLTHGYKVSFTGKAWESHQYGVDEKTHMLDYDAIAKQVREVQPKLLISGISGYPRKIDFKAFAEMAAEVDAYSMADIAHLAGLVVGEVHPSPFPYTDVVTTTTHKTLRGPRGAIIMCKSKLAKKIDRSIFPALQGGPHNNVIAAMATAFHEAQQPEFKHYARQIVKNAKALADTLTAEGISLVTGGTDNHLLLIDVSPLGIDGALAETVLDEVGITVNKNAIPYDTKPPMKPSGIRLGTPAITTRGMKEQEMQDMGKWIANLLKSPEDRVLKDKTKENIAALCKKFPLYEDVELT